MDTILAVVAKILEIAANIASDSTSIFVAYQPKRPDCMTEKSESE